MLDLFTIFSKGGIVLWYFQGTGQAFTSSVNALIKTVILQERGGSDHFNHEALALRYKLDNEFELVFVVAYQKILQLSYVDKFLSDIQKEFRDKYREDLQHGNITRNFNGFTEVFNTVLGATENAHKQAIKAPKVMKTFGESAKSQKSIASMIVKGGGDGNTNNKASKKKAKQAAPAKVMESPKPAPAKEAPPSVNGELDDATIQQNLNRLFGRPAKKTPKATSEKSKAEEVPKKKGKAKRQWEHGGTSKDAKTLDFSNPGDAADAQDMVNGKGGVNEEEQQLVGQMRGAIRDMEAETSSEEEEDEDEDEGESGTPVAKQQKSSGMGFGFLSGLKNLVGSKTLTEADIQPCLEKMRDHLIAKNVASDISDKLCSSVSTRLEGKVLGTFNTVTSTVKTTLHEACVQLLSPRRRIDILRDAMEARQQKRPYTIAFCGVNGVGKSTNLAKVAFWLVENGFRVLIAACDTFRAGAVEQLRTHTRKLNALHPSDQHSGTQMVQLYEKGYGKDAAGIAMEAINFARDNRLEVVLIDTAGRMQDNEPLMRALAKLMKVNQPDLVLFVGEALVGNEAVDQLTKFNQALADHSSMDNPRLIDGILLTKFDTIDDKVGAAISMTYTTGQPIVFVGTGQTYTDLKNLNAKAVVHALLKA